MNRSINAKNLANAAESAPDAQQYADFRKLFDALPDETWFYPGHGKDSTLGAERPSVAEWRARGW